MTYLDHLLERCSYQRNDGYLNDPTRCGNPIQFDSLHFIEHNAGIELSGIELNRVSTSLVDNAAILLRTYAYFSILCFAVSIWIDGIIKQ